MTRVWAGLAFVLALAGAAAGPAAAAQDLSDLAFQPHPGAALPLAATLQDEHGRPVRLGEYFTGKPVVLVIEYLHCKTLCGLTLENVVEGLAQLPLVAGRDYQLVAVSIDPRDGPADAAAAKSKYLTEYHPSGGEAGMHFLTGAEPALRELAEAVGFSYRYDAELDQFLHPAGFVLASPGGQISRYFLGVDASPAELKSGLADAAAGRSVGPLTRLLLFCHIEGNRLGRYTVPVLAAFTLANLAGAVAVIAVFAAIRRRRHG